MVAALQPRPDHHLPAGVRSAAPSPRSAGGPQLRLIEGGAGRAAVDPVLLAGLALVTFVALVVGLRMVQGGPPASTWDEQQGVSAAPSASATPSVSATPSASATVFVAAENDTWWAIAERLAPDADTTEVVSRLIEANGGPRLDVGQVVVVPAGLDR
jgi:hypothetical protein